MARFLCLFSVLVLSAVAFALLSFLKREVSATDGWSSPMSFASYMVQIIVMCKNNGGSDETVKNLDAAMVDSLFCALHAVNGGRIISDARSLSNETRTTFFPRHCPTLKTVHSCFNGYVAATKPCLQGHDFEIVDALWGTIPDAIDLICKNDGEILFKMNEPDFKECANNLDDSVKECAAPFRAKTAWDMSHLTQDQCSTLSGLRECVQRKLNVCKAPDLINVYDLFHNKLLLMTPCHNFATSSNVTEINDNAISEA